MKNIFLGGFAYQVLELRKKAEQALGPEFNVREFHDAVLMNGPVPLSTMEEQIEAYIEKAKMKADQN